MFLFKVPTFAFGSQCNSWSLYRLPGQASVMGWTELGCLGQTAPSPTHPSFLSTLPHSIYLPLSHRLCGSPACCLVTDWSELDIIMTAMLIRRGPVFSSLSQSSSIWVAVWGQARLSEEVNELRPNKQKTSKRSLCILAKFVWNSRSKIHTLDILKDSYIWKRIKVNQMWKQSLILCINRV